VSGGQRSWYRSGGPDTCRMRTYILLQDDECQAIFLKKRGIYAICCPMLTRTFDFVGSYRPEQAGFTDVNSRRRRIFEATGVSY
jgi:hypothetical protein